MWCLTMASATEKCVFCDKLANTREHVIPQWLQNHFNLQDQRFSLWNGTSMPYRQAIVPACKLCNSKHFSKLESKIRNGDATGQEYYLWALKIRYCLHLKDSFIPFDRKRPSFGSLLPQEVAYESSEFIKHTFRSLYNSNFIFKPNPFGSVFLFNQSDEMKGSFGLIDVPPPYWALSIALPTNKLLLVLFKDAGVVKKQIQKTQDNFQQFIEELSKLNINLITFTLLISQAHFDITDNVKIAKNMISSKYNLKKIRSRHPEKSEYRSIAKLCGIPEDYADNYFYEKQLKHVIRNSIS